jgi:hypothetical protein
MAVRSRPRNRLSGLGLFCSPQVKLTMREAPFHLKQPRPALLANGPGSSQYKRSPALIPPRFGAKPLEQQLDWRISGEYDRPPIVILSFLKNSVWPKYLGAYRQGSKLGGDSPIRGVKCTENADFGRLVLESWSHNSRARAGSPR